MMNGERGEAAIFYAVATAGTGSGSGVGGRPVSARKITRMASTSIRPARPISIRPTQGTGSLGSDQAPAATKRGSVRLQQGPNAHRVHEHHRQPSDQPHPSGPPRAPQPHGHAQQRQSGQQLVAGAEQVPERLPHRRHPGSAGWRSRKNSGTPAVSAGDGDPPGRAAPAGQLLQNVAAQPRADIERVVHERGEGHQGERHAQRLGNVHHFQEIADAVGVDDVGFQALQLRAPWANIITQQSDTMATMASSSMAP